MIPIRDTIPSRHAPIVTVSLIVINTMIFILQGSLTADYQEALAYAFGLVPARYTSTDWVDSTGLGPSWWPFISNFFLHGGFWHLLGNMWSLWLFGDNVEDRMGKARFLLFYLLCGVAASLIHLFVNPSSIVPAIGASGAIAGVMGAYFALFPGSRLLMFLPILFIPFFFEVSAFVYLAYWFIVELVRGSLTLGMPPHAGGIAFWAHVGGFATGFLLHPLFLTKRAGYRPWYPDEDSRVYPYRGFWR